MEGQLGWNRHLLERGEHPVASLAGVAFLGLAPFAFHRLAQILVGLDGPGRLILVIRGHGQWMVLWPRVTCAASRLACWRIRLAPECLSWFGFHGSIPAFSHAAVNRKGIGRCRDASTTLGAENELVGVIRQPRPSKSRARGPIGMIRSFPLCMVLCRRGR